MTGTFEFATAGRVLFGPGTLKDVPAMATRFGNRALLLGGSSPERSARLKDRLESAGIAVFFHPVSEEPSIRTVQAAVAAGRESGCEVILGFGGGSVIDTGKAVAALLANGGEPLDYIEVVGKGRVLTMPSLPFIAIPTTAGTGAEVTRNAVLVSEEHGVKASLRSPFMLPSAAVVDPETTLPVPPAVTAATGLDALTQLIEPYLCKRANPLTDSLCREGIRRVSRSLRRAFADGSDLEARSDMSLAGLFSGMALANAGLGAVHGLAGPLGGLLHAPHGAVCARLLPIVMEANLRALEKSAPGSAVLKRFSEVASLLTGEDEALPADGTGWLAALCGGLGILPLSTYGLDSRMAETVAAQAMKASSMKGNPVELDEAVLIDILHEAL
ncbi:MAG: iron-containing alcohol dehydrogenase [Desulfobacteraceae bacterium]|nr:iron-containing alcohol dehydrogenase [Desulfobacteraceae bacterium]